MLFVFLDMFINMRQCCGYWKNIFLLQNDQFFTKFSRNMYFSYPERFASAKVEKDLSLQRNYNKVTLILMYHISGF